MTTAIIIGGGIAGCSTAYALARRGIHVTLLEQHAALATEASGNPLAMLYPKLSVTPTTAGDLAFAGFLFTRSLLKTLLAAPALPKFYDFCGLLQLAFDSREAARQQKLIKNAAFIQHIQALDATAASEIAGIYLNQSGLYFPEAGWIKPQQFCQALVSAGNITIKLIQQAVDIQKQAGQWRVETKEHGGQLADIIVLCNANAIGQFQLAAHVPVAPVRGQLNFFTENAISQKLKTIICSDHFMSPAVDGWHSLGTSYAANDLNPDLSALDTQQNLAALQKFSPAIYQSIDQSKLTGRVGWRSATPDYLPLAGQLLDRHKFIEKPPRYNAKPQDLPWLNGLYINAGHGSKGMITAPICAELIANLIMRSTLDSSGLGSSGLGSSNLNSLTLDPLASSLPVKLISKLNPSRFLLRKLGLKQLANSLY